ncbi:MAG: nucleotidyltransferase domain-containing protein [Oscillospiraceae bacterium]|nr:nucleotidyltransferase domain-containing protein [Oscillospiraceae bacterium]
MDKATVIDTVSLYAKNVISEYSPSAIIIFGSHINGTPHKDSDIDVGVVFDGFDGDWLDTSAHLWKLRRGISFDIEPHLLDKQNDDSGFVAHVMKTGKIIYQR